VAGKLKYVPKVPLFSIEAIKKQDGLEERQVWTGRLLYLLATPIKNEDLQKIDSLKNLNTTYPLEGMTLGDVIQLQQIVRAMNGDTKAYNAINKTLSSLKTEDNSKRAITDPMGKMVSMLYSATKEARKNEKAQEDAKNMFGDYENIIEVEINPDGTSTNINSDTLKHNEEK
jgi:hypothetical protein